MSKLGSGLLVCQADNTLPMLLGDPPSLGSAMAPFESKSPPSAVAGGFTLTNTLSLGVVVITHDDDTVDLPNSSHILLLQYYALL